MTSCAISPSDGKILSKIDKYARVHYIYIYIYIYIEREREREQLDYRTISMSELSYI